MLFDLRHAGRRRTIKAIYVALAVLMGGGLILFGVGGSVSGGLLDAFSGGGGGGDSLAKQAKTYEKRVATNPRDAAAWGELVRLRYQDASQGQNYNQQTGTFTGQGQAKLRSVGQAWDGYLAAKPAKPDPNLAALMVRAYLPGALNQPAKAVAAEEIIVDSSPPSASLYYQLAVLAYQAGQTRKAELAGNKALSLAQDKTQRQQIKDQLDQAKAQAAQQGAATVTTPGG